MSFTSINPATGQTVATYFEHTPDQLNSILEGARIAQRAWAQQTLVGRIACVRAIADALERHVEPLARNITKEMGKPIEQSRAEIRKCAYTCRYLAEIAPHTLSSRNVDAGFTSSRVSYEPLGTVLSIMPWNFPFWQFFRFAAPALLAGNAIILKHAPTTMGCGILAARICAMSGIPVGLVADVRIGIEDVARVIADDRVHAVTFTGSTAGGSAVAAIAGRSVKKCVMELGGSDPYIICDDANIDLAVQMCVDGRTLNSGQSCIAAKRFIVHESIVAEFTQRISQRFDTMIVGDPMNPSTEIGPLARADLRDTLRDQVARACANGACISTSRCIDDVPDDGYYVRPALLVDVDQSNPVFFEELFGPVAAVTSFSTIDEAIKLANASPYGLGAAVCSTSTEHAATIAQQLECGTVFINGFVRSDARLPFGGVKQSGFGRELGEWGFYEFVNVKNVTIV